MSGENKFKNPLRPAFKFLGPQLLFHQLILTLNCICYFELKVNAQLLCSILDSIYQKSSVKSTGTKAAYKMTWKLTPGSGANLIKLLGAYLGA